MPRIDYNKLVRDRIPEIIESEGRQCGTDIMGDGEHRAALLAKLVEEAQEVQTASPDKLTTELADLLEVVDAIMALHGLDEAEVRNVQQDRREQREGFARRIKLLWTM